MPAQIDTEDGASGRANREARIVLAKHPCVVPGVAASPRAAAEPPEGAFGPAVYVVRSREPSRRFAWEIRRLSAIVVERSRDDFATADDARADGHAALAALTAST